jgi:hypothetical protein
MYEYDIYPQQHGLEFDVTLYESTNGKRTSILSAKGFNSEGAAIDAGEKLREEIIKHAKKNNLF